MAESIPEFLTQISEKYGDRTALYIRRFLRTTKFSYREMEGISAQVASFLLSEKLKSGDSVLIWAPNIPEWVLAFFGALSAGIVVVPVGLHSTSEVVEKYIDQTKPKVLFVSKYYPIDLKKSDRKDLKIIYLEELVELVSNVEVKKLPPGARNQLAEIVFTSGTTGEPKGVMISHNNVMYEIEQLSKTVPRYKHFRLLSVLPLSHVMEQVVGLVMPLFRGATIFYLPRINTVTIRKALQKQHVTDLGVVPQMLRMFLDTIEYQVEQEGDKWLFDLILKVTPRLPIFLRRGIFGKIHQSLGNKLFVFGVGSAPLDVKLAQAWEAMGIKVVEGYGASETTGGVTVNKVDHRRLGSVGKRLPGMEVILSPEKEILAKGDNVTSGYFQNDEKTKESFTTDGYFKTGDVGYFDKDGWLYITGREKFKIVTAAGDKVYPEDVERKLNAHPDVWDSCVLGIKKGDGEIVYATLILKERAKHKIEEIVKQVNSTLEPNQQILDFSLWKDKDFPRLHTLKVDRNNVKASIENKLAGRVLSETRKNQNEDKLVSLVSQVTKVPADKVKEDSSLVTDLGLDSLKRVELVSLLEEELSVEIDEAKIDQETTVKELRHLAYSKVMTKYPYNMERVVNYLESDFGKNLKVLLQDVLIVPFYRIFVRIKSETTTDLSKLPTPVIFAGNHPAAGPDVVCFWNCLPRKVRKNTITVASSWTWNLFPPLGLAEMILNGTLPLDNYGGAIARSLEGIADVLEQKSNLIIFPEKRPTESGQKLNQIAGGLAIISQGSGVPIVPFFINGDLQKKFFGLWGFNHLFPKGIAHVQVKIGEPFNLEKVSQEEANNIIREKILNLS